MYDRPAEDFKKTSIEDKHKILLKLSKDYDTFVPDKRFDQITFSNLSFFLFKENIFKVTTIFFLFFTLTWSKNVFKEKKYFLLLFLAHLDQRSFRCIVITLYSLSSLVRFSHFDLFLRNQWNINVLNGPQCFRPIMVSDWLELKKNLLRNHMCVLYDLLNSSCWFFVVDRKFKMAVTTSQCFKKKRTLLETYVKFFFFFLENIKF